MNLTIHSIYCTLAIAAIVCFFACTTQVAGPTTDVGNPQLIALVVDKNNVPISNADVSVYRIQQMADSTGNISSALKIATGSTKADGSCRFDNLVSGQYTIQGFEISGNATGVKANINLSNLSDSTEKDTIILLEPGRIIGVVSRGAAIGTSQNSRLFDSFIQVKLREIDLSFLTNADGKYQFYGVPAGVYTVLYYAPDGFYTTSKENIIVQPGQTSVVDSVILKQIPILLPPKNFAAQYDTAHGQVRLSWSKVDYTDLRWYEAERIDPEGNYSRTWHTTDTTLIDTVQILPESLKIYYVVRSVDNAFNVSKNSNVREFLIP